MLRGKMAIVTGLFLSSACSGYIFGQMSGMVDALRGRDKEIGLTEDDVSWVASTINLTCVCGFFISGLVTERFGRRRAIVLMNLPLLIMWIMVNQATSMTEILISRVLAGVSYGGIILLTYVSMVEYTSPSKRATCINIISAVGPAFGTALGHILSILLHWRTVALIGIVPTGLSLILPLFWVESPSWLASKGRFDECKGAFRRLHGDSDPTEAELRLLINFEHIKQKQFAANKHYFQATIEKLTVALRQKYFWKVVMLCAVVSVYRIAGGRVLYNTLAITMLQDMTGSSNILLFMLLVDGFIILGSILSCFFLNLMRIRPLLFWFGSVSNAALMILSVFLYYAPRDTAYYPWTSSSILAFYFIISYAGPYAVLEIILAELYPLEFKTFLTFVFGGAAGFATFLSIKLAPSMFISMGYYGVFLLNTLIVIICQICLWIHVPETKGRTMQEIELFFRHGKFEDNSNHQVLNSSNLL